MNKTSSFSPILGCQPVENSQAEPYHHRWLVIDTEGQLLTRHTTPKLEQVEVAIKFGFLVMRASGMVRLDLPLDVIEDDDSVRQTINTQGQTFDVVDEGDLPAAWLGNLCGQNCRLVKVHPDSQIKAFEP